MDRGHILVFIVFKLLICSVLLTLSSSFRQSEDQKTRPPHIIVILADDLGWNDVSFHGSNQIPTPNIDALAYNGIILNSHYVQPLCSPSRSAFMTGKYPLRYGMQHLVILEPEPRGLSLNETLLPQYLKSIGYSTHILGKWHLGFYRTEYTPTKRGFDSHYGYWNGLKDYYDHTVQATFDPQVIGYDFRRNLNVDWSAKGKYTTHLLADEASRLIAKHNTSVPMFLYMAHLAPHTGNMKNPFQAPDEEIAKFSHVADPERRIYAAMVSALDQSVGTVVSALRAKGMLDNSIILFMSDNGAPTYGIHSNRGSNFPLRGQKHTPWDGGSRGVAAIWSPLFKNFNKVSNHLMHITDWLPTFWRAAGQDPKELGEIDGVDQWRTLSEGAPSTRTTLVDIDELTPYAAIRSGDWKLVNGTTNLHNLWYGDTGSDSMNPIYDPKTVMSSPTGAALSGFITETQIRELKMTNGTRKFTNKLLTHEQILSMRINATLPCEKFHENSSKPCDFAKSPCLFNIRNDPCESVDLAGKAPIILQALHDIYVDHLRFLVPAANIPADIKANPALHNGVWISWQDDYLYVRSIFDSFTPGAITAFSIFLFVLFIGLFTLIYYVVKKSHWYKNTTKARSFTRRRKMSPRNCSPSSDYSNNREPIVVSPITVAQRIEMFEERDHQIS